MRSFIVLVKNIDFRYWHLGDIAMCKNCTLVGMFHFGTYHDRKLRSQDCATSCCTIKCTLTRSNSTWLKWTNMQNMQNMQNMYIDQLLA